MHVRQVLEPIASCISGWLFMKLAIAWFCRLSPCPILRGSRHGWLAFEGVPCWVVQRETTRIWQFLECCYHHCEFEDADAVKNFYRKLGIAYLGGSLASFP